MTRRLLRCLPLLFWVAAGAALPACQTPGVSTGPSDADFVSCAAETRATPYQPGMQVTSTNGTFIVKLLSNTFTDSTGKPKDQAFTKGIDVWRVEVDWTSTMAPMDGLAIRVDPEMPDHNHGTTPVGVAAVGSGGMYVLTPVNLYMAGYWVVTLSIDAAQLPATSDASDAGTDAALPAPISDTAALKICVPD
jgi:hypothetical protein